MGFLSLPVCPAKCPSERSKSGPNSAAHSQICWMQAPSLTKSLNVGRQHLFALATWQPRNGKNILQRMSKKYKMGLMHKEPFIFDCWRPRAVNWHEWVIQRLHSWWLKPPRCQPAWVKGLAVLLMSFEFYNAPKDMSKTATWFTHDGWNPRGFNWHG